MLSAVYSFLFVGKSTHLFAFYHSSSPFATTDGPRYAAFGVRGPGPDGRHAPGSTACARARATPSRAHHSDGAHEEDGSHRACITQHMHAARPSRGASGSKGARGEVGSGQWEAAARRRCRCRGYRRRRRCGCCCCRRSSAAAAAAAAVDAAAAAAALAAGAAAAAALLLLLPPPPPPPPPLVRRRPRPRTHRPRTRPMGSTIRGEPSRRLPRPPPPAAATTRRPPPIRTSPSAARTGDEDGGHLRAARRSRWRGGVLSEGRGLSEGSQAT